MTTLTIRTTSDAQRALRDAIARSRTLGFVTLTGCGYRFTINNGVILRQSGPRDERR